MAEKLYKIGQVAKSLGLNTSVLRYWEMEFPELAPQRTASGQRAYTQSDFDLVKRLRHLLHDQGLTLDGAHKVLAGASTLRDRKFRKAQAVKSESSKADTTALRGIKAELEAIKNLLK